MNQSIRVRVYIFVFFGLSACATPGPQPFLWTLEKNGQTSQLAGILHAGAAPNDVPEVFRSGLRKSSALIAEVDPRPSVGHRNAAGAIELAPGSPGLDMLLGPDAWTELQARLKVPANDLKRLNPFFASWLLDELERKAGENKALKIKQQEVPGKSVVPVAQEPGPLAMSGMQNVLLAEARARDLPVSYLDERTQTTRACAERAMAQALEERLGPSTPGSDSGEKFLRGVVDAYRAGDFKALSRLQEQAETEGGADGECTVQSRNRLWAEKIVRLHGVYAPALFTVGIGHIVTKKEPLLELLEEKGFTVRRSSQ